METNPKLLKIREAGEVLRVGPKKVHELIESRVLEGVRLGEKTYRVKAESLDRLVKAA